MGRRSTADREHERQKGGAFRRLWRVIEEFSPGGWGHEHLSTLALLAGNGSADRPLPERARTALEERVHQARATVVDRLSDIAIELHRVARDDEASRLERMASRVDQALVGVPRGARAWEASAAVATELATACRDTLHFVVELRRGLVGRVAVDLEPLLAWMTGERHALAVERGTLTLALAPVPAAGRRASTAAVLVGVIDLVSALEEALAALLEMPARAAAHVGVRTGAAPRHVELVLTWTRGASGFDPAPAVHAAFLPLEAYGAVIESLGAGAHAEEGVAVSLRRAESGSLRRPVLISEVRAARSAG